MLAFFTVLQEFGISLGDDISQLGKVPYDEMIAVAVYAGHRSYCFEHETKGIADKAKVLQWVDDSILTRKHMKEINVMWLDFIKDYGEGSEKKKKAG